ncbi:uncharacterized protein LOC129568817 isoform X2 [Sitodiplosis mosellana]|uniref:uncharacterized protein LOC129568817 isoform X2 n=1 Tax=Sitodiplosis mosellana TaxID=263140 RepID=UPI0024451714|nr:uncharacterized protein LOC129568817 isoform X2 [Sitodiplosis mosellana]
MFLQSKIKYKPPVQSLNILWKKESNSDLFIDIFSEKAYKISLDQVEQQIKTEKERGTWNVNNNEGSSYNREIAEHHLKLFQRKSKDDGKVSFSDFEMYALGMYPFACNISHSCVPNVSYYGNGASLVCKVIRPIRKGDQIFISYRLGVPTFEKVPISAMEKQCRTEYHFKCECIICSTDFFLPTKYEINFTNTKLYKDIMEANSMTIQAFRKLPREKLKYYEECAIKFLERYDRFHPINETIEVWRILITIWLLFTTRFH